MFKSYYCEKLEKTLHFLPDKIKFCCSCAQGPGVELTDYNCIDKDKIFEEKEKIRRLLKKGHIPKECEGCIEFKELSLKEQFSNFFNKEKSNFIVKHIIVDHFKQCDCKCVYCSQKYIYEEMGQKYELLPIIKQLYELKMIDNTQLKAEFQGGGIAALKEFEQLMTEFHNHGCNDFVILMNGIKYLPIMEKIGNNPKSHICISLDAGTKETFYKIKGIDAFEQTIQNIKTLREKSQAHIALQYIIVKDINDNLYELEKFLNIVLEIGGIEPVSLEIDYRNTLLSQEKFIIPKHYYDMFNCAEKFCKNNGIWYMLSPYTKSILQKGCNI